MIVLVTGGRGFTDHALLWRQLDAIAPTEIIEGGQRTYVRGEIVGGADHWAQQWAVSRHVPCRTVEARWDDLETPPVKIKVGARGKPYNALAGFNRNQEMVDLQPDRVVACPGGSGTADCVGRARAAGIQVIEVRA